MYKHEAMCENNPGAEKCDTCFYYDYVVGCNNSEILEEYKVDKNTCFSKINKCSKWKFKSIWNGEINH